MNSKIELLFMSTVKGLSGWTQGEDDQKAHSIATYCRSHAYSYCTRIVYSYCICIVTSCVIFLHSTFFLFDWTGLRYIPGLDGKLTRKRKRMSGSVRRTCTGGKEGGAGNAGGIKCVKGR